MKAACVLLVACAGGALLQADEFGSGFSGYSISVVFHHKSNPYLLPPSYGGITLNPSNPNELIIGGTAEGSGAAFHSIAVTRDALGHIQSLTGRPTIFAAAPKLAAGAAFGPSHNPGEVFFYTIASGSGGVDVGMVRWGQPGPGRTVDLVPETPGGLGFAPLGVKGVGIDGGLKILTASGKFYSATYLGEPSGTYRFTNVGLRATLPVRYVEGFAYMKGGSAGFPVDSLLVAEWRTGTIAAYDVDSHGDPIPASRRTFFSGPPFAFPEGLFVDPLTNDLLVTTHGNSGSSIYRISGFAPPASIPLSSCQTITQPGFYHLTRDLVATLYRDCLRAEQVNNVHIDCRSHSVEGWNGISLNNVNGFSVRNCRMILQAPPATYLWVSRSRNGLISGNTFGPSQCHFAGCYDGWIYVMDSQSINVVNNQSHSLIGFSGNTTSTIRYNRCHTYADYACIDIFSHDGGVGNVVDSNDVEPTLASPYDPGIWATGEKGLIVSNNRLKSASNGIALGNVSDAHVHGNTVEGSLVGFWSVESTNVTWSENQYTSTRTGSGPDAGVAFVGSALQGNQFLRNIVSGVENRSRFTLPAGSGNLFTRNDFGFTIPPPDFGSPPAGAVVDGFGNRCTQPSPPYPLICTTR